jgi:hypothetical protein
VAHVILALLCLVIGCWRLCRPPQAGKDLSSRTLPLGQETLTSQLSGPATVPPGPALDTFAPHAGIPVMDLAQHPNESVVDSVIIAHVPEPRVRSSSSAGDRPRESDDSGGRGASSRRSSRASAVYRNRVRSLRLANRRSTCVDTGAAVVGEPPQSASLTRTRGPGVAQPSPLRVSASTLRNLDGPRLPPPPPPGDTPRDSLILTTAADGAATPPLLPPLPPPSLPPLPPMPEPTDYFLINDFLGYHLALPDTSQERDANTPAGATPAPSNPSVDLDYIQLERPVDERSLHSIDDDAQAILPARSKPSLETVLESPQSQTSTAPARLSRSASMQHIMEASLDILPDEYREDVYDSSSTAQSPAAVHDNAPRIFLGDPHFDEHADEADSYDGDDGEGAVDEEYDDDDDDDDGQGEGEPEGNLTPIIHFPKPPSSRSATPIDAEPPVCTCSILLFSPASRPYLCVCVAVLSIRGLCASIVCFAQWVDAAWHQGDSRGVLACPVSQRNPGLAGARQVAIGAVSDRVGRAQWLPCSHDIEYAYFVVLCNQRVRSFFALFGRCVNAAGFFLFLFFFSSAMTLIIGELDEAVRVVGFVVTDFTQPPN